MASCATAFLCNHAAALTSPYSPRKTRTTARSLRSSLRPTTITAKQDQKTALQYRKLGDSDLEISEITLGTMTFGEQSSEKEAHEILSYAFDNGINILDTAEAYPIPMKKETRGLTDLYIASWLKSQPREKIVLATKVCGYSETSSYLRDNAKVLRVDAANIRESVEKSLKRLGTDYIDLLQIHWPDRYVTLFGTLYWCSNETSYGVMEFVNTAKVEGLPKIVSIQNNYSLLVRTHFEIDLVEVCLPQHHNIGFLAYSPLAGGALTGKYIDSNSDAARKGRLNLFPGYMERYNKSIAREATIKYIELAKKHRLTPVQLALGFARDRPFITSSIIGATSVNQLKEDIDAFLSTERPLPAELAADIEDIYNRYRDPTFF
ncbi:putative NADP-dependent oxidoreductase domain-containing protein [Rosa chinensis]|uniref:Putative NADP-dependent oxidoreductase domain-containing protein n=1 Tax=Rosa chinensis TaxID=74649 RepID=A0A2P6QQX1_ROSCH|nr:putative NADP-dependent oxidoreductase domain-containing protein [Rosa chinensis]